MIERKESVAQDSKDCKWLIYAVSILVTAAFGYFILHEKLKKQSAIGLVLIVVGTLSLLI